MRILFAVLTAAIALGMPAVSRGDDKVVIDINRATERKMSVAVPTLIAGPGVDAGIARKAAELLAWDLNFSGVFSTINTAPWEPQAAGETLDSPAYKLWRTGGAIMLVRGTIERRGEGYGLEFRLYDTVQEKVIGLPGGAIGKRYQVGKDAAPAVHAFANVIMELVTRNSGPFGTRIAFEYRKPKTTRKDLWVVNLDGSGLTPLTQNNMLNLGPAWSPDGRHLAYTSYKRRNPDLFLMDLSRGTDAVLSAREGSNTGPTFTPDGKHVAAALSYQGNSEIYLLTLDGKIAERLTNNQAIDIQPTFSPDGQKIAFTSDRIGNPNVFLMDRDGSNVQRLTFNGKYNASPAWSPTGKWIAYASRDDGNIWIISPDGEESRRITNGEGSNEDPSWSPDGRYVVFSSNRSGTYDLWAADIITGTVTRITNLPGDERRPAWGPYYIK